MKTLQSEACVNCCNPDDISENFQDQLRAWKIVMHRKQRFFNKDKFSSKIEKYVDYLSMKYSHLSTQEFLQAKPVQPCLSEASHKNQYSCRKCLARDAQPRKQALTAPMSHDTRLAIQMSHFEKKSRKCACPKCPVLKSSYCNIEYMPDGNAKPVDGICPCCRNADNHGQSIDDEDTEDEREQEECPTAQPYLQMLHDEERCIDALESEENETALMSPLQQLPCAGKNCPARFNSFCSVKTTKLPLGEVQFECPCDNVCIMKDCVHCNPKETQPETSWYHSYLSKEKSRMNPDKYSCLKFSSNGMYSAYAFAKEDSGNVSDGSSCNSPILLHQKTTKTSLPP